MTIIQPNKNRGLIRLIVLISFIGLVAVVAVVFDYLQTVGLKHDIEARKASLDKLRVENVELKNKFFQLVDFGSLETLAKEKGLIQEKNPQWVSASHL